MTERLVIAEKPSLARTIARALDAKPTPRARNGVGWIETAQAKVTWCFGHMLELAPPEHYDPALARWSLETLPIRVSQWVLRPIKSAEPQLDVIRKLLRNASEVIHAGDPDREGQMLVDELLEYLGWSSTTRRVLIRDTTRQGIVRAFREIRSNAEFAPLYRAALCRARADWLVGMNLTRAATKRIGPMCSVGRVQTPTLALVVRRDRAIEGHVTQIFYTLAATVATRHWAITLVHDAPEKRIFDRAEAAAIAEALRGRVVTLAVTEKEERHAAPLPHTLASFQKEAEAEHGWSAKVALEQLQELYDQQLVSYPRTDCPYLPAEFRKHAAALADAVVATGLLPEAAPLAGRWEPRDAVYDDRKVEEHYGLVPTSRMPPEDLAPKLKQAWLIVARRFLASLAPDDRVAVKRVSFVHDGRVFAAKGSVPLNRETSWRRLYPSESKDQPLPSHLRAGDAPQALVRDVDIRQGKTTPPKPYTEASLIDDMRAVAKYVDDPRLKAILKETSGIGTAATQADIIETLKQRGYVEVVGRGRVKHLRSTPFGRYLIDALPATLADPGITAAWEDQLTLIARSAASDVEFMRRIDGYVSKYVEIVKTKDMPPLPAMVTAPGPEKAKRRLLARRQQGKKRLRS